MLPDVQFFLSRPSYPLGGTLLGTVLIRRPLPSTDGVTTATPGQSINKREEAHPNNDVRSDNERQEPGQAQPSLRDMLSSVTVYVAGFCKIDARWHNVSDYMKIYGRVHPYVLLLQENFDADLLATSEDTVCFWSTNGLEALDLPERKEGSHPSARIHEKGDVLSFTFAVKISTDLPHSTHSTTCRYFYSANVLIKSGTQQQQIIKRQFQVTTNPQASALSFSTPQETIITSRVKFGNCTGVAHSKGLPCHLTSSEIQRPKGQMTVVQRDYKRSTQHDVQTIRVSNAQGRPVCIMTVVGAQTMVPGSPLHIQWDFPKHQQHQQQQQLSSAKNRTKEPWIPCYQVSACLQGEEFALFEDGITKRVKSLLFDTCHEWVDPGVTDHVSKTMILTGDTSVEGTPCNITTDIMKVVVRCQVDITVSEMQGEFNNLSFQIPCQIRHCLVDEDEEMELEENQVAPLLELLTESDEGSDNTTREAVPDLKILSELLVACQGTNKH
ncbi:MAG: hypothetical protein SGARI_002859 [Bacillariaceae sp.]